MPSTVRHFSRRIDGYLQYYGKLKNQEGMLRDRARVDAYKAALESAPLQGATVMDIGTGSGILAFLAARAGARRVYAVEASPPVARLASRLARANGFGGVVQVVPKHVEDITEEEVPTGSVDVIVSELFSHFLVGELGLQAVTMAKKRFLRPGGLVLPATAELKLSPFEDPSLGAELRLRHKFWMQRDYYGLDLSAAMPIAEEQQMRENIIDVVRPESLLVPPEASPGYFLDLAGPDEPSHWRSIGFEVEFPHRPRDALIDGVCGWWDAFFNGAGEPAPVLSTSPAAPLTVWAQCRFLLNQPLRAAAKDRLIASIDLKENKGRESYACWLELRNATTKQAARAGPIELSDVYARQVPRVDGPEPGAAPPGGDSGSTPE